MQRDVVLRRYGDFTIERHCGPNVGEGLMGFVIPEPNTKELTQRSKLVVSRWAKMLVFVEQPERPLVGAQNPGMSGQETVDSSEPRREKGGVKGGVVRD
jgi:hypothetical protein